jgi:hypothetical protein
METLWKRREPTERKIEPCRAPSVALPSPLRSACVGIAAARSEQLRGVAEGYEAIVGDPERVA